jgi:hypothetical protein
LATWTGTKKAPLQIKDVLVEIKSKLDDYDIVSAVGDQFCSDPISQDLLELGITYKISSFGVQTRAKIFTNLRHLLIQGKIHLFDHPELLGQLRNLREERTDRGQIDVRPSGGMKDDLAVAVALVVTELMQQPSGPTPFLMPTGRRYRPENCSGAQATCSNFPNCVDDGLCQYAAGTILIG